MNRLEKAESDQNHNKEGQRALVAAGVSWLVSLVGLLAWTIYNLVDQGTLTPPFLLLSISLVVYFAALLYLRRKYPSNSSP